VDRDVPEMERRGSDFLASHSDDERGDSIHWRHQRDVVDEFEQPLSQSSFLQDWMPLKLVGSSFQ
jgi:hypothetical protein